MILIWRIFPAGNTNSEVRQRSFPLSVNASTNPRSVSPRTNPTNLPQDLPEEFDDEELAQYAEEFTKGELDDAADEYFDLNDWDGIDDAAFAAALEDQEMQM